MRYTLAVVASLLFALQAVAAPTITAVSGTLTHGSANVVIAGSGFGTHANYGGAHGSLSAGWKNMEDGVRDSDGFFGAIASGPANTGTMQSSHPRTILPGSTNSYFRRARNDPPNDERGGLSLEPQINPPVYYVSFWMSMDPNTQGGKPFRAWSANVGGSTTDFDIGYNCPNEYILMIFECSADGVNSQERAFSTPFPTDNTWHRVDFIASPSTDRFSLWQDRSHRVSFAAACSGLPSPCTVNHQFPAAWNGQGHTLDFPNMIDNGSRCDGRQGAYNYDDIYVDWTLAHVELCNANTFAGSTHCEVQPATAWADGSITTTLNRGSFASNANVYLYVLDSAGTPNASGFAVTLGGASSGPGVSLYGAKLAGASTP